MNFTRRLFVILDFHQDIVHEIFGGDGFPDWALAVDELHLKPINRPILYIQKRAWYLSYYISPLVKHIFWLDQ
jgi:hypothetical protein